MNNRYRYICKAKRKDNGEWVEGFLYITHKGEYEISRYDEELDTERITSIVIPETVGQCTELKDKNGKWIFEGDVLGTDTVSGFVLYENGCFAFRWKNNDKYRADFYKNCILTNYARINELEAIGNIHDTPELLEVER